MKNTLLTVAGVILAVGALSLPNAAHATTWACTTNQPFGDCFSDDPNPLVQNNVWGNQSTEIQPQILNANSVTDWEADADMTAGNTAVVSYPSNVYYEQGKAIASYSNENSTWDIGMPGYNNVEDAEAAYDIWLGNGPGSGGGQEVMIWVDNQNQTPAGSNNEIGTILNHGVIYKAYATTNNTTVSLVAETNSETGEVGLKTILEWVQGKAPFALDTIESQVDFGFEICNTDSVPKGYFVENYTLGS
jgi:hypothetical protein